MKKSTKWLIAICIISVLVGSYGFLFYGWFGIDLDGYTADQSGKKIAYKLHGAYKQREIDQCFRDIGFDPDNLDNILEGINTGRIKVDSRLKECIELKTEGYASPKKDLKTFWYRLRAESGSHFCGERTYSPRESGIGGTRIKVPQQCGRPFTVEVEGTYYQKFNGGNPGYRPINVKTGRSVSEMPRKSLLLMPCPDVNIYGIGILNGKIANPERKFYGDSVWINVNVSQAWYGYSAIKGKIKIKFYD